MYTVRTSQQGGEGGGWRPPPCLVDITAIYSSVLLKLKKRDHRMKQKCHTCDTQRTHFVCCLALLFDTELNV